MVRKQVFQKPLTPNKMRKAPILHAPGLALPERKLRRDKSTMGRKPNIKVKKMGADKLRKMVRALVENIEDRTSAALNPNCWFVGPLPTRSILDQKVRYKLHKVFTEHIKLPELPCAVYKKEQQFSPTSGYGYPKMELVGKINKEGEDLILTLEGGVQGFHEYDRFLHPSNFKYHHII